MLHGVEHEIATVTGTDAGIGDIGGMASIHGPWGHEHNKANAAPLRLFCFFLYVPCFAVLHYSMQEIQTPEVCHRLVGLMDKVSPPGAGESMFESGSM